MGMGMLYSIDPGLSGTGWAEWKSRRFPNRAGVIPASRTPESGLLADQCEEVCVSLLRVVPLVHRHRATHIFIEMPQMMTNVKGIAAQGGSIYKLTFLVGYIARALCECTVHTVTVAEWKGQLPKDVVQRRIERELGIERCRELGIKTHAYDAVGIGLWATGMWR